MTFCRLELWARYQHSSWKHLQKARHKSVGDVCCSRMPRIARFTDPDRKLRILWAGNSHFNQINSFCKILKIIWIHIVLVRSSIATEVVAVTQIVICTYTHILHKTVSHGGNTHINCQNVPLIILQLMYISCRDVAVETKTHKPRKNIKTRTSNEENWKHKKTNKKWHHINLFWLTNWYAKNCANVTSKVFCGNKQ